MPEKHELRQLVRDNLAKLVSKVNATLRGEGLEKIEPVLNRLGRGSQLPHWFEGLKDSGTLPNMDGKTIGSVVEMLLVAVLETDTFAKIKIPPLRINPARGVDLPDLDLGVKSPSENYCTSEPFFSAYERLLGSEHDAIVLLTDYQTAKKTHPLRMQISKWKYLNKTQIADERLCRIAKAHREWLMSKNESLAKKVCRFLAFVNQSDWRAKKLLTLVEWIQEESVIKTVLENAEGDFNNTNAKRFKKKQVPLPDIELETFREIRTMKPLFHGIIEAADNWVMEVWKGVGIIPTDSEWNRYLNSPLDGAIGMSFALQWRYNFGRPFGKKVKDEEELEC